MVKNIIKLAVYAVLIIFCGATYKAFSMFARIPTQAVKAAGKFPKKPPVSQPKPTTAPGKSLPAQHRPTATSSAQSELFVNPGKNIPPGLSSLSFQTGKPSFQYTPESPIPSVRPAQITFNTSPFLEGNALLEAIKATTTIDISNPNYEKQTEENLLKAINDLQTQGFTVFLVPKNAASFLGENQLIPQEQAQWLTQEVSGKAYAGSIKLDNGNIIVLARSRVGGLYGIADPAIKTMANYLQNFHMPETTKDIKLRKSSALLASTLTDALEYTRKQEEEKLLSEPIVPEEKLEIKPEDKEPDLEVVKPVTAIPIPPKQPIQPAAEFPSQKEIKDITKIPESPADIIEPHKEAEDRTKELAEEKSFQDAEKARLEKELAEKEEISQLEQELDATNQEIATNKQKYQEERAKIAQETERINADLDQELVEFEKKQREEKEQAIAQAKAEAKRIAAVNNLDIEQQDKLFKRLENNYQEKIVQDFANKKQIIETEKNKRIKTAKSKIKKLEAQQEELQEKQKLLHEKVQQQESLSLEIVEGTKILADMINKWEANELLRTQIRQKATDAQKQFDLEKQHLEAEFNQKLQNSQQERVQKYQKNREELKNTLAFIRSDSVQQQLLLEQLEKNESQEAQEIKNALEIQKKKKTEELEQWQTQKNQKLQQQFEAEEKQLQQKQALLETEREEYVKNLKQKLSDEKKRLKEEKQALEDTFQNKKNELEKQKKIAQQKSADKEISNQKEIDSLEQELKRLIDQHTISEELLKEQTNRVEQVQAQVKELKQQELQAQQARAKEAQEKVLLLQEEAANKKAELELAKQNALQTQKNLEKAGKNVVQIEQKKEELERLAQELEQQIPLEKKELSQQQQEELLLKQEEDKKIQEAQQAKAQQELAKKEETHLEAKMAEQKALTEKQAAQEAAEKIAKDLDDAIKEQQKQEQLLKEKEEEKKRDEEDKQKKAQEPKLNIEVPGGGDGQLPQDEEKEQEPIQQEEPPLPQPSEEQPEQKLPITKLEEPPSEPQIEITPVLSEKVRPAVLSEQIPKVGVQQPTVPPFQGPLLLTQDPVFLGGQVPKTSISQPIVGPLFEVPSIVTQDPVFLDGQVPKTSVSQPIVTPPFEVPSIITKEPVFLSGHAPKTSGEQPSPISIPAAEIKKPMIERVEQALPKPKLIKKPESSVPKQAIAKPIEHPKPHSSPAEPTTPEQTRGSSGPVDMTPLSLTPFKPRPFPELELKTFDPYFYPRSGSASRTAPTPSYGGISSSGSYDWATPEQPQTYLPEAKTRVVQQQVTPKKPRLSQRVLEIWEKWLHPVQSDIIEQPTAENKGIGAWLRGLSRLQKQHEAAHHKPPAIGKTPDVVGEKEKPKQALSFIQNVTATIKDAVTAVIDRIGSYINRLFS